MPGRARYDARHTQSFEHRAVEMRFAVNIGITDLAIYYEQHFAGRKRQAARPGGRVGHGSPQDNRKKQGERVQ